jgi:hypothetical protein
MYNPSLRQEPRYEPAVVIPLKQEASFLDWLGNNGRLIARDKDERESTLTDDEEIADLMDVDDHVYDDDDDDLLDDLED